MKKSILLALTLFLAFTVFGQAGSQTFNISAGAMFPLGSLSDNNLSDSSAGASSTGYHLEIGYNYQLSDNFGIGIHVEFNNARYSMKKVTAYYEDFMDDARREISSIDGWTIGGLYLSYYFHLPISQSLSWDLAPMLGGMGTYSPEYHIKKTSIIPPGPNPTKIYYRQRSKAFSFAYGLTTRLNLKVNQHAIFLQGNFLQSKINLKHVTGTGYDDKPYDQKIVMVVKYITASIGYSYYF